MTHHIVWCAALALFVTACGDKRTVTGSSPPGSGLAAVPGDASPTAAAPSLRVEAAWTWGPDPKPQLGLGAIDPKQPRPTGPAFIAVGKGRVVIATRDGCLELLDAATGRSVVSRTCEQDGYALGLGVVGDVAVVARYRNIIGVSLTDLKERWRREVGFVQSNQPHARPSLVDNRLCSTISGPGTLAIECLDVATGKPVGSWSIPPHSRVAFGERRVGVIPSAGQIRQPAPPPGLDLPVKFFTVEGNLVHEGQLAAPFGPTFEQARPIFLVRGGGNQSSWIHRFCDADGAEILTTSNKTMLRGAGVLAPGQVVTTGFGLAASKDRTMSLAAPAGSVGWTTDLGVTGAWDPWHVLVGGTVWVAHDDTLFAVDHRGAILERLPIASSARGVWHDRALVLVEARETRSDSDFGDAAVYVIDATTRKLVFEDKIGRDIAGGQHASAPVFDGDLAVAIVGGRVRAYRSR